MPAPDLMPAVSLVAMPGRRAATLELAKEIEARGFSGVYSPSFGDCMGLCLSLAHTTSTIRFGTAIQPIYFRHPVELAQQAAYIHEISGGRFVLGIGVSHGPVHQRLGLAGQVGKPLQDIREYVAAMRAAEKQTGPLPPIVLATLRDKMLDLSVEIADGAVWANASRSAIASQVAHVPAERVSNGFFLGDMLPTVVIDDESERAAAHAVHRKTLTGYVALPNYRNYWKAAGYAAEMASIEQAQAAGDHASVPGLMTDTWLNDNTLSGTKAEIRAGVAAWQSAGISTPILVPSSTKGGQLKALQELFTAFE